MRIKGVSPLIATIILIALTVSIGAIIVGWGRSYVQKQTSCLGMSIQLSNLKGGASAWNITITNIGEQPVLLSRLKGVIILKEGGREVKTVGSGLQFYMLNGIMISNVDIYSINPGEAVIAEVAYPNSGSALYIYFEHELCGEISNRILAG